MKLNPHPEHVNVIQEPQELHEQESLTKLQEPSSSRRASRPVSTEGSEYMHAQYRSPLLNLAKLHTIWFGDRGPAIQLDVPLAVQVA